MQSNVALLKNCFKKDNLLIIVGLAFMWPYLRLNSYANVWLADIYGMFSSSTALALDIEYVAVLVAVFVCAFVLWNHHVMVRLFERPALAVIGAVGLIGLVLLSLATDSSTIHVVCAVCGLFFTAVYLAVYFLAWGVLGTRGHPIQVAFNMLASYLLCQILLTVVCLIQFELSYLGPLIPPIMAILASKGKRDADLAKPDGSRSLPWAIIIPSLILLYLASMLTNIISGPLEPGRFDLAGTAIKAALSLVAIIILTVLFLRGPYSESKLVIGTMAMIILYSALGLLIYFFPDQHVIMSANKYVIKMLLWIILACTVSARGLNAIRPFAFYGFFVIAVLHPLTSGFAYETGFLYMISQLDGATTGLAILVFAAIAVGIALLIRYYLKTQRRRSANGSVLVARDEILMRIGRQSGLSERELEVLPLIYRGYSAKKIAEILSLAESTVRGHIMHIYRKLDVHTRQELIDIVDTYSDQKEI